MNPTLDEIEAMVHPPAPTLVAETEDLCRQSQWAQAQANLKRLMKLPHVPGGYTQAQCHHGLADCAMNLGRAGIAIRHYQEALRCDPSIRMAHENLIFLLDAQPWTTDKEAQKARDAWWRHIGAPVYANRQPHTNTPDPEKRLRVGYVSADFRFHSAGIAFIAVVTQHTPQIEPVLYSTLPVSLYDHVTKRDWKERFGPAFVDVSTFTPEYFAQIVREDQIDILVDLSGYTAGNRLFSFAHKPAPIQATAWGYATGAGWPAMDVLFADPVVATPAMRARLPERVVDLPCVISFFPRTDLPEANPLPCLTDGPTFGVFQRAMKINEDTLRVWKKILQQVPESTILFKGQDYTPAVREWIVSHLKTVQRQVSFGAGGSHQDHQHWYQQVDLSLDPWPQTGGVSTMEACWMGVPCVTLVSERVIQRTSASILTLLGLPDLITSHPKQYIQTAVAMVTTKREQLAEIRKTLRDRMKASPILTGYRDAVETQYRSLWREWCANQQKEQVA
jgi:predicted O-linked N-acetylglucosamine transferase (SPINDLY family)